MQKKHFHPGLLVVGSFLVLFAFAFLWALQVTSRPWELPFTVLSALHPIVELVTVLLASLVFFTGYSAKLSRRKGAVVWLGIAFLGVALLSGVDLLADDEMHPGLTSVTYNLHTYAWLSARALAITAMMIYTLLPTVSEISTPHKHVALFATVLMFGCLGYFALVWPGMDISPQVVEMSRPTLNGSINVVLLVLCFASLGGLWIRRKQLAEECLMALVFAVLMATLSELMYFTGDTTCRACSHVMGDIYRLFSFVYLFHATSNESLERPITRLQTQHRREQVTLSAAPDGIVWVDIEGNILMANAAMEELTGYQTSEMLGQNVTIFLPERIRTSHAKSMRGYFTNPHPRAMGLMDLKLLRKDGRMLPVDISLGHWDDEGTIHAIAYIRDLTERKKFEESLRFHATHDELTGLPNRWFFRLQLGQALANANRTHTKVAALFLDLDDFKTVNDSFGHKVGDALLVQVGARIRNALRQNDVVARLGGDEFAILLTHLCEVEEAVEVVSKLLLALEAPYRLQDQNIYSGASVGLAFYPVDAQDSDTLLRYADMAMYQAKRMGRGVHACYDEKMDRRVNDDMALHGKLKQAIERGVLQLHYQPQVDVRSGEMIGVESLLRWEDEELGNISPVRFIPLAESTGLILPLADWVLETACQQIASWTHAGTPLLVAVNFSAQQFYRGDLPEKVKAVLERTGAPARWLNVEITESVAMTRPESAREQIHALVGLGCTVALDDFGTGYSSLSYLKALPVTKLKIDKSFIEGVPTNSDDVSLCRAIITLAHNLGLTIVAEGIETEVQLSFLRENGCEVYQGWLFGKAQTAQDINSLMAGRSQLQAQ